MRQGLPRLGSAQILPVLTAGRGLRVAMMLVAARLGDSHEPMHVKLAAVLYAESGMSSPTAYPD